jgi:hypothetical protein
MVQTINNSNIKYRFLKGENIVPKDDAFHGNINLIDVEWWYFDAVFNDDYSIHVGLRIYHLKNSGYIETRINIYKKGKIEVEAKKRVLLSNFNTSTSFPYIEVNNKPIVEFDNKYYNKTGKWKYKVSLKIDDNEVNLNFLGTTKGWKMETSETSWTVALPKAKVTGEVIIREKKIIVNGIGYHDHNWGYSATTMFTNIGWYWGRITGEAVNITWAKTMINPKKGDLLTIINQDVNNLKNQNGYYNIHPKNIFFSYDNFIKNKRQMIPTKFYFKIKDSKSEGKIPINVNLQMNTIFLQHSRIFTAHYWRYHVNAFGEISIGSYSEILDGKPQIMEFLSFKSYNFKRTSR